ncbi:cytochrome c-550 PedF [Halomonas daqingensis]|uniref:Cytochrome c-550 PedF n=1 Tax=Billgrantia desiderata TaxID=52021 RepID=A0ABS9B2N5_9GAMM|nr:cytochrome c-550 PedF [Halomonas desiderata]MCE8041593.1 cytochrome c-550 PedF [Halomonas desiderata]MCE8046168.1 cytochrome c-550 PedF [Halomonas desiderata]
MSLLPRLIFDEAYQDAASRRSCVPTALVSGFLTLLISAQALSHGDVTPQPVDTRGLESLGEEWLDENPYRAGHPQHELAVDVGASAYNANCAACHGLEAKSGGIAPDLRELENGAWGDEWYKELVTHGSERGGRVLMPRMSDYVSQEGLWAIRAWLETVSFETAGR